MVAGRDLVPGAVPLLTVARKEKMLSLAVTSPLVPLSKNCCAAAPPMRLRSAVTVRPVLGGLVPPATETVSRVDAPACRLLGFAEPVPVGGVVRGVTVSEMEALGAAGLCVGDGGRQGFDAAQGVAGHGGLEGEDVVVGGGVAVGSVVEK